jgi:hypothetical protein
LKLRSKHSLQEVNMTFAQFVGSGSTGIIGAINLFVVPFITTLAFLVFVWGGVKYFFINGEEEKSREEGRQFMLWGILGLVAILTVWSFVRLVLSTLDIV